MEIVANDDYRFIKQDWKCCVFASKNGLKIMCMTKLSTFASSMLLQLQHDTKLQDIYDFKADKNERNL